MDKKFLMNIKWKDFVKFEWLLAMFHDNWGIEIKTELVSNDPIMFKALVSWKRWCFTGHWDADDNNVNSMIAVHKIRMAETRAIARALRWYNNIWMCSVDELWWENNKETTKKVAQTKKETKIWFNDPNLENLKKALKEKKVVYPDYERAIKEISKKYAISKEMKKKIEQIFIEREEKKEKSIKKLDESVNGKK